jgi:hypothetical protein
VCRYDAVDSADKLRLCVAKDELDTMLGAGDLKAGAYLLLTTVHFISLN